MRSVLLMLALALAGCAGSAEGGDDTPIVDAGTGDVSPPGCVVSYDPIDPIASAVLPESRVPTVVQTRTACYVSTGPSRSAASTVAYRARAADGSQIGFLAPIPGPYTRHARCRCAGRRAARRRSSDDQRGLHPARYADASASTSRPVATLAPRRSTA